MLRKLNELWKSVFKPDKTDQTFTLYFFQQEKLYKLEPYQEYHLRNEQIETKRCRWAFAFVFALVGDSGFISQYYIIFKLVTSSFSVGHVPLLW